MIFHVFETRSGARSGRLVILCSMWFRLCRLPCIDFDNKKIVCQNPEGYLQWEDRCRYRDTRSGKDAEGPGSEHGLLLGRHGKTFRFALIFWII